MRFMSKCPPLPPPPCLETCTPPPPAAPPCRPKPTMRGLHMAQTKRTLIQALVLSALAGTTFYLMVGRQRRKAYRDFYKKNDMDEWAEEMAKKGLFQAVPVE